MKISSFFLTALMLTSVCFLNINATVPEPPAENPASKGIEFFNGTWTEALEKSKKEGKPIFADIYAVWCGPCKMMSRYVFTNEEVGQYYNENFICLKVDAEKGEGPAVARKYSVRAYPTLLFVGGDGKIITRTEGARSSEQFIKLGQAVTKQAGS